jgi:hypothetical protein
MRAFLFYLYIVTLPFSFAFSFFGGRVTLSILTALCMLAVLLMHMLVRQLYFTKRFLKYLAPVFIFCVYVVCDFVIAGAYYVKSAVHSFSYIAAVCFFFLIPILYGYYFKNLIKKRVVFNCLLGMVLFSSVYTVMQFILFNWYQINLDEFVYWPAVDIIDTKFLGKFYRAKGFAAEPAHFAFFLECFIPLIFYYLFVEKEIRLSPTIKTIIFSIIIISLLFTVSSAAFVVLPLAITVTFLLNFQYIGKLKIILNWRLLILIVIISFAIYWLNDILPIYDMVFTSSVDKLDSSSSEDRLARLAVVTKLYNEGNILTFLFGHGSAATMVLGLDEFSTIVLLYPLLFTELGVFGLILFVVMIVNFFLAAKNLEKRLAFFYQMSLLCLVFHYFFISNYWYPYIWFLGVLPFIIPKAVSKVE